MAAEEEDGQRSTAGRQIRRRRCGQQDTSGGLEEDGGGRTDESMLAVFFHLHSKQFRLGWRSGKTDLAVNESCKWQVVKEIGEILPDVGVSVLAQALIVEAVHLRYLAALVIPAQNRDAVFEPNLTHKHKSID